MAQLPLKWLRTRKKSSEKIALSVQQHIVGVFSCLPWIQSVVDVLSFIYLASLLFQVRLNFICYCRVFYLTLIFYVSIRHNISEQGRRNDLKHKMMQEHGRRSDLNHNMKDDRTSLVSVGVANSSDSVHCNRSTQFTVSSGWSCHTSVSCTDKDVDKDSSPHLGSSTTNHPWVHIFSRSTTTTSLRTQCAAEAYRHVQSTKVLHRRSRRAKKKERKLTSILRSCSVPPETLKLTLQQIHSEVIVFDGGNSTCPPIKPPDGLQWHSFTVDMLHVEDVTDPNLGLTYHKIDGIRPFIRMPRNMSLRITANVGLKKIMNSLEACEKLRRTSLSRGDSKKVFSDYGTRPTYVCVGPQVSRNSNTVLTQAPFMESLSDSHWRSLVWMMRRAEYCFRAIAEPAVLSHLDLAKRIVPFKTFISSSSEHPDNFYAQYFGGIAFGKNVFLRCHTDQDFTFSIIQVFLKGNHHYKVTDEVVVYFCFPTIGVAVPLRPGDYLLFNAKIPHCVSSRCRFEDEIVVTSMYLKTAIVGMNDNDLPLTNEQAWIIEQLNCKN